jgi:peptidoglycan/xylan/chitin deacetylase (PgdA/CDA1 family)
MQSTFLPLAARICQLTGFMGLCSHAYGGLGLILMFHRFTNEPDKRIDRGGMVSGKFLDKLIGYIRNSGLEIIRLNHIAQAIAENRKFVCLTIDDGYRDNSEIALPVLQRHNAPATIFIPSLAISRSLDSWWLQIEELSKEKTNPPAAYAKMISAAERDPEVLEYLRSRFLFSYEEINERYFMSAAEIIKIASDPLIEIGGHTLSHPLLANLNEKEALREIRKNKEDIEDLLQCDVNAFAYPFGNSKACGSREFNLAFQAGYKIGVTTRDGNIFTEHIEHLTALPRYSIRGHLEDCSIFEMQKTGTYRALRSRLGPAFVTN